jgi:nucleotide-binding universal stress UspA family protein
MYDKILIPLDTTPTDRVILDHVRPLAKMMKSQIVLLHVADGWAARTYGPDAVSREIDEDRAYLEQIRAELMAEGFEVESKLAFGDPATEIVRWVQEEGCNLIAMSTHGHRFLSDLFLGTTATRVQHRVEVPVLLLKAPS